MPACRARATDKFAGSALTVEMELDDALDDALARSFDAIDRYRTEQAELAEVLKKAFFELARAKVALGPLRVGQNSYDLAPQSAQRIVRLNDDDDTAFARMELAPDPSADDSPADKAETSGLRRRRGAEADDGPPSPASPARPMRDPARQFAALPPPSLRASQAGFVKALECVARVVSARQAGLRAASETKDRRAATSSGRAT